MELNVKHRLGTRAFFLFMVRHVRWTFLLLILVGILWFFALPRISPDYLGYATYSLKIAALVITAALLFMLFRAFIEYRSYEYRFEPEFFHIARGYLSREEQGVVYHQIQTVSLRHGLTDRMFGVRHLVIIMNGSQYQHSEVILPALDRNKALLVQRELLRQARSRGPQHREAEEES